MAQGFADAAAGVFDWPSFGLVDDVREAAAAQFRTGRPVALATLAGVRGSAPRPLGSRMLVDADGRPTGYVSGGCVEAAVAAWAEEVLAGAPARLVPLGAGSPYVDVRLPCGGAIEVWIERIAADDPIAAAWTESASRRAAHFWLADLKSGARGFVGAAELGRVEGALAAAARLAQARPGWAAREDDAFARREEPRLRLILVGGDPVTLALARLGETLGADVFLVRERGPADGPHGLAAEYRAGDAARTVADIGVDRWTAVASTTHDAALDAAVLAAALAGDALYVGALGSRGRRAERLERLAAMGVPAERAAALRSPVGLDIGASTPFEIAVSVLADIIRVRRRGADARDVVGR